MGERVTLRTQIEATVRVVSARITVVRFDVMAMLTLVRLVGADEPARADQSCRIAHSPTSGGDDETEPGERRFFAACLTAPRVRTFVCVK